MTSDTPSTPTTTSQGRHPTQTTSPRGVKRRRSSPDPAGPTSPNILDPSSNVRPAPGSSSRKSVRVGPLSADMQHSTAERPRAVKFTKTGRISRAAKGQPVHYCDECDKTYTRAEHLRRHQQNHKPGAFACDVVGCTRSFYREDLLTRHKARHNDSLNPPSRRGSVDSPAQLPFDNSRGSSQAVPPVTGDVQAEASSAVQTGVRTTSTAQPETRAQSRKSYIPVNELHIDMPISVDDSTNAGYFGLLWPVSPAYSSGFGSPTHGDGLTYYTQPPATGTLEVCNPSFYDIRPRPGSSRSPASVGSSTAYTPLWSQNHAMQASAYAACLDSSPESANSHDNAFGSSGNIFGDQHWVPDLMSGAPRMISANDRDLMEPDLLVLPSTRDNTSFDISLDGTVSYEDDAYLDGYWHWIHPFFPILHRSSFSVQRTSPLLRAAVLALGAHSHHTGSGLHWGRVVHERCMKVLKKRTAQNWHTYRNCDMQAVVLVEIFSIFRSRRPPLEFSNEFKNVYRFLAHDPKIFNQESSSHSLSHTSAVDLVCKQNLLLTCYLLDHQHSTLFGRQLTDCLDLSGTSLPFPRSQQDWNDSFGPTLQASWPQSFSDALSKNLSTDTASDDPHDAFQSSLMLACLADPNINPSIHGIDLSDHSEDPTIILALNQSARTRLAYHMAMLCKHSPVRELLAVAGESWVMAEKLCSQAEFTLAQTKAKDWASGASTSTTRDPTNVQQALYHAVEILRIHAHQPRTGLLYQEWSIYLASVAIWARAYATTLTTTDRSSSRLSIPNPMERRPSQSEERELEQTIAALFRAGSTSPIGRREARHVLLWTKTRIEQMDVAHNCGVTNGAVDVLKKLLLRGDEPGWFGEV